ncbi:MAG: hypothetical protein ACYCSG_00070 [Thermoplasmataceae archaeon]
MSLQKSRSIVLYETTNESLSKFADDLKKSKSDKRSFEEILSISSPYEESTVISIYKLTEKISYEEFLSSLKETERERILDAINMSLSTLSLSDNNRNKKLQEILKNIRETQTWFHWVSRQNALSMIISDVNDAEIILDLIRKQVAVQPSPVIYKNPVDFVLWLIHRYWAAEPVEDYTITNVSGLKDWEHVGNRHWNRSGNGESLLQDPSVKLSLVLGEAITGIKLDVADSSRTRNFSFSIRLDYPSTENFLLSLPIVGTNLDLPNNYEQSVDSLPESMRYLLQKLLIANLVKGFLDTGHKLYSEDKKWGDTDLKAWLGELGDDVVGAVHSRSRNA